MGLLTEADDQLLGGIENRVKDVIHRIRKGNLNLTADDRAALDRMVLVLLLTDPYAGVKEAKMRERVAEDVSRQLVETAWREGMPVDSQRIKSYIMQVIPREYVSIALMSEYPLTLLALDLMGLTVHDAKGPVVIGDSPVLASRAKRDGVPSLLNLGSEVALPISSKKVLIYHWATAMNVIQRGPDLTCQQTRYVGKAYYHENPSRYIFGRTKDAVRNSMDSLPPSQPAQGSGHPADGWRVMQILSKEIEKNRSLGKLETQTRITEHIRRMRDQGDAGGIYRF